MNGLYSDIVVALSYLGLFTFVILVAKWAREMMTSFDVVKELVINDNVAFNISYGGYMLSVTIVYLGSFLGPHVDLVTDLISVFWHSLLGIVMLNISVILNDKLILHKFSNTEAIIKNQNLGVAMVQFGSYLASSLVIAGSLYGEDDNIWLTLILFSLGQVALILFAMYYNWITPWSVHEEIESKNTSAGIALSGNLIAAGVLMLKGAATEFETMTENITFFLFCLVVVFIAIPVVRYFMDKVIIPESRINHEIKNDQNAGAAFLEFIFCISFAIIIFIVL